MSKIFKIDVIHLNNKQDITPRKINIIVGPNNCGKTTLLKDIYNQFVFDRNPRKDILLKDFDVSIPNNWSDFKKEYSLEILQSLEHLTIKHISPDFMSDVDIQLFDSEDEIDEKIKNFNKTPNKSNWKELSEVVGESLVSFFRTSNRLLLLDPNYNKSMHNYSNGPTNLMSALTSESCAGKESDIEKYFYDIFEQKIKLLRIPDSFSKFKLDTVGEVDHNNVASIHEYDRNNLDVSEQGDGYISGLNVLTALTVSYNHPIVLVDEPEAFMHPSQIYMLGKNIPNLISDKQQLFVTTHSVDFVRGVLANDINKLDSINIIHMNRGDKTYSVSEINNTGSAKKKDRSKKVLTNTVNIPFLNTSTILEGLFHKYTIVCESDGDVSFYKKALEKNGFYDDVNFVACGSYSRFEQVTDFYNRIGNKFLIIGDIDVIVHGTSINSLNECKSDFLSLVNLKSKGKASKVLTDNVNNLYSVYLKRTKIELESDYESLQKDGINAFNDGREKYLSIIIEECKKIGLFFVPCGVLESWYPQISSSININNYKSHLFRDVFQVLDAAPDINGYPELKNFADSIKQYLKTD